MLQYIVFCNTVSCIGSVSYASALYIYDSTSTVCDSKPIDLHRVTVDCNDSTMCLTG